MSDTTLRLVPGGERYELKGKRIAMGLGSDDEIDPGGLVRLVAAPQLVCKLVAFVVDYETATAFELVNFTVGRNCQMITADPIPLEPFGHDLEGFPAAKAIDLTEASFASLLDFDACPVGVDMAFELRNRSKNPTRAALVAICDVVQ